MWLLIDDIRNLNCDVTARTAEEGKRQLQLQEWDCVCLDHDLGFESVESGYDVLVWAIDNKRLPNQVQLVTSNPVGRMNMQAALVQAHYESRDGTNWKKRV